MKLLFHVLKKNDKLGIDNRLISNYEIRLKLEEEYKEVVDALINFDNNRTMSSLKEIIRETYDLIQMCILILWRCHLKAKTLDEPNLIQDINIEHKDKLVSQRSWTIQTGIEVDVKE